MRRAWETPVGLRPPSISHAVHRTIRPLSSSVYLSLGSSDLLSPDTRPSSDRTATPTALRRSAGRPAPDPSSPSPSSASRRTRTTSAVSGPAPPPAHVADPTASEMCRSPPDPDAPAASRNAAQMGAAPHAANPARSPAPDCNCPDNPPREPPRTAVATSAPDTPPDVHV